MGIFKKGENFMWRYIVKRLLWMIVILIGVAFVIFTILYFAPGDPAEMILGSNATAEELQMMRAKLGVDQPYAVQLGRFLFQTFIKGDLGISWTYESPIIEEMGRRLPRSLLMNLAGMVITTCIGIPLGIQAARHQGKWQDYGVIEKYGEGRARAELFALLDEYDAERKKFYPDGIPDYEEIGDTAFITFDEFKAAKRNYYLEPPTPEDTDTDAIIYRECIITDQVRTIITTL